MKYFIYALLIVVMVGCETPFFSTADNIFRTPFEKSDGEKSSEYEEVIDYYKDLAKEFASISFKTMGKTDSGKPLHLVIYSPDAEFNLAKYRKDRTIILINNATDGLGIEGVDATMVLFRNLAQKKIRVPDNVIVVTIPVYNISGKLRARNYSEADYDLNSDLIKGDVENTFSFVKIFQEVQPDIFIENGFTSKKEEDFAHSLTYSTLQKEQQGSFLGGYIDEVLIPRVTDTLLKRQEQFKNDSLPKPFWRPLLIPTTDTPRSTVGYASLWNCMAIRINTHSYHQKPYKQLVEANYEMMKAIVEVANADNAYIKQLKIKQAEALTSLKEYPIRWEIDSTQQTTVDLHTFEIDTITEIVHLDHNKPIVKQRTYYNKLKVADKVSVPESYIVPQIWDKVIDRLKANNVEITTLDKDTTMTVSSYGIDSFKTVAIPFEGHYLHYDTKVAVFEVKKHFLKGDYIIKIAQPAKQYLLQTLEPQAPDSFFNWNFFDIIIQQRLIDELKEEYKEEDARLLFSYPIYRIK